MAPRAHVFNLPFFCRKVASRRINLIRGRNKKLCKNIGTPSKGTVFKSLSKVKDHLIYFKGYSNILRPYPRSYVL